MGLFARTLMTLALATASLPAAAAEPLALYQGRVIVTGTGEATRQAGFVAALEDVLVQVSGDQRLLGDPRVAALSRDAASLVASFTYRDRMEGIPFHDEQGSRDRPHDLTVTFDRAKIDAALRSLGREPWTGKRPTIVLLAAVENPARTFMLAAAGKFGVDMRIALEAASSRAGLPVLLPKTTEIADAGFTADMVATADAAKLDAVAQSVGGDHALAGTLTWSDAALGWVAEWRLDAVGESYRWAIEGVSFDAAFRNALRGAAQVLSGNGAP